MIGCDKIGKADERSTTFTFKKFPKRKKIRSNFEAKKVAANARSFIFCFVSCRRSRDFFLLQMVFETKTKNGKINKKFFKKLFWFVKQNKTFIGLKLELTISSDG